MASRDLKQKQETSDVSYHYCKRGQKMAKPALKPKDSRSLPGVLGLTQGLLSQIPQHKATVTIVSIFIYPSYSKGDASPAQANAGNVNLGLTHCCQPEYIAQGGEGLKAIFFLLTPVYPRYTLKILLINYLMCDTLTWTRPIPHRAGHTVKTNLRISSGTEAILMPSINTAPWQLLIIRNRT